MAKQVKKESAQHKPSQLKKERSFTIDFIPEKWQTPVFLGLILILILIFFNAGLFGGKVFSSADNVASESFKTFLNDAKAKGEFPLWVPYIFNGMPSFAALVPHLERMYDFSHAVWVTVRDLLYLPFSGNNVWAIVLFYIIFAFSFYFLAEFKFKNKLIALYCALAAVFITPIIQMIIVGHNSKMIAVMMFPAVFLILEKIYDMFAEAKLKESIFRLLLYFGILVFFLHIQMSSNHVQMLFYFFSGIGIYLIYRLIYNVVKKINVKPAIAVLVVFIIGVGLSAMMYADSYLSSREYNKYSIRGVPPITQSAAEQKISGAADYEYSTNWSFSPVEVMTFFVPYWVGFGDVEVKGQRANTYWGQMPFTTSPMYFGVITILLAFIGIYYNFKKSALVQALVIISFISLILSFGRTFPVFYDILFYNLPYFSSFRAPVMIHILINVAFTILAGYGIKSIIDTAKDRTRSVNFVNNAKYIFPILALPVIISIIGFESYYKSQVESSPIVQKLQQQGANPQQIQQYLSQYIIPPAYDNVKSEMLIIGVLLLAVYGICYYFIKGKIKYQLFGFALIFIMMFDLWHIDFKTLHWDNKTDIESNFKAPDWVDWILKNENNTYEFRVLNLQKGQPVRENTLAYWRLQNNYGYQGAKLRVFQNLDDAAGLTNPNAWKIMNTKYIITDQPYNDTMFTQVYKGSKFVLLNRNFHPKAFFVKSYKVAGGLEILDNIKNGNFEPKELSYLEKEPGVQIEPLDSTAKVQITSYDIHNITLEAEASGNNLLFLSEVYYPAGWKAYIDGQQTEIYKTNYTFRSIILPKGRHKIEFKFEPETYYTGKSIAMGTNVVLILIFAAAIGGMLIKRKKTAQNP